MQQVQEHTGKEADEQVADFVTHLPRELSMF